MNSQLLILGHDPSDHLRKMIDALICGARSVCGPSFPVQHLRPLDASAEDVFRAQGVVLVTPENLGYMSGALKDFFDRSFYALLDRTDALPYAALIRARQDGTGTKRAIESICRGMKWKAVQAPVICRGEWRDGFLDDAGDLGATMAAGLEAGIF